MTFWSSNNAPKSLTAVLAFFLLISSVQGAPANIGISHRVSINISETSNCTVSDPPQSNCSPQANVNETQRTHHETLEWSTGQDIRRADQRIKPSVGGKWTQISRSKKADFFIMTYEASKSTKDNRAPLPISEAGREPWNQVTQSQAKKACQRLGDQYHLPTNREWQAALGDQGGSNVGGNTKGGVNAEVPGQECQVAPGTAWNVNYCLTGTGPSPWSSPTGTVDMIGNLWEWTATIVDTSNRSFAGESGYIQSWDANRLWPTNLSEDQTQSVANSWFFASNGTFVVRRGGDWSTSQYSGPYTMSVDRHPSDKGKAIGFRCVYRPD